MRNTSGVFAVVAVCSAAVVPAASAQSVETRVFGTLTDGGIVHEFTLDSGNGMKVGVLDYGGIIRRIEVPDRRGRTDNVVLSLASLADHERRPNFSAIIGRYANRLSGGGVMIDGTFHKLAVNAKGIISHGGDKGFGSQLWTAAIVKMPDRAAVSLRLVSPAGQNGFPGRLDTRVTFSVGRDHSLRLDYQATTDAPTVLNLTHHAFFNLAGAGSGSVDRQWIRIFADRFTPLDDRRLPTGELKSVTGTSFDLRRWAQLGERMRSSELQMTSGHGFDHNFVLHGGSGRTLPLAACAFDPGSGRLMLVHTDQPGLQLYTANGFDGSLHGGAGRMLRQGDGFAIETQHYADSPRFPRFPSTVLRAGQRFTTSTSFTFHSAGWDAAKGTLAGNGACT